MKIFAMEKELRRIKNRGHFLVPLITPQGHKIETSHDKDKVLEAMNDEITEMLNTMKQSKENYEREQERARIRDKQLRSARQTNRSDFNFATLANSTQTRSNKIRTDQPGVHCNTNPVCHIYSTTSMTSGDNRYEPPANDSILQGASSAPTGQFTTNATNTIDCNNLWRCNNGTNTATHITVKDRATRPTGRSGFQNNSENSSDARNGPTCFKCGEQGHMRLEHRERVYCTLCRTHNHDTKACRKQRNNIPSPTNSHLTTGYHSTATPPPLIGTTMAPQQTHQMGTHNNRPLFQNIFENNQPRTSTTIHTPFNSVSPAPSINMMEGLTQIVTQVANNNKRDEASKQMMKNIKIFDGSNKAECITLLSEIEAAAKFTNTPFRELICQSMAPTMLDVLSELSALASDVDIKNAILANYSDIPSTTEAASRLQNLQTSPHKPLVTFNHRYKDIHKVAFGLSSSQQENRNAIVEYAKKLPLNTRDKLLRKIAKKNSYIKTLDDAFKQAIEINRETSFVEAASGRYNNQNGTKIETQINKLDDSFQDCNINAMNTRPTNRSEDGSFNGSFDRSSSRNNSFNSSQNFRSSYRNNNYSSSNDSHNSYSRQGYNRDNNRYTGHQQNQRYEQRNPNYQNRYDNNQDRNRFDNRRRPNKYQHHRNQHKTQIIFEFPDQVMIEIIKMVRGFINLIKANPTSREQYKVNKLAARKEYDNKVNESEIHSSNLGTATHQCSREYKYLHHRQTRSHNRHSISSICKQ